jgi:hypothetical protein
LAGPHAHLIADPRGHFAALYDANAKHAQQAYERVDRQAINVPMSICRGFVTGQAVSVTGVR